MFTLIIALESNVTRNAKLLGFIVTVALFTAAPLSLHGESAIRIPGRAEVPLQQPNIFLCAVAGAAGSYGGGRSADPRI
jgi:hypothetical protein